VCATTQAGLGVVDGVMGVCTAAMSVDDGGSGVLAGKGSVPSPALCKTFPDAVVVDGKCRRVAGAPCTVNADCGVIGVCNCNTKKCGGVFAITPIVGKETTACKAEFANAKGIAATAATWTLKSRITGLLALLTNAPLACCLRNNIFVGGRARASLAVTVKFCRVAR
jgi:hypothetical protein